MAKISFNGKTYDSLEEMPAAEREAYTHITSIFADANQNGVPDIFEGDITKNMLSFGGTTVVVDGGQSYTLENMPPAARAKYEQAITKLQQVGLIPRGAAHTHFGTAPQVAASGYPTTPPIASGPLKYQSVVQEDKGPNIAFIVVAVVALLLVCGLGAVAAVLLFSGN
jgi:hypothetical protein